MGEPKTSSVLPDMVIPFFPARTIDWKTTLRNLKNKRIFKATGLVKSTAQTRPSLAPLIYIALFSLQQFIPHPSGHRVYQPGIIDKKGGDIKHGDQQRPDHQHG